MTNKLPKVQFPQNFQKSDQLSAALFLMDEVVIEISQLKVAPRQITITYLSN